MRVTIKNFKSDQCGETLMAIMVSIALGSIVLTAAVSSFLYTSKHNNDVQVLLKAESQARIILDMMVADLRMIGSGMPLGQQDFAIGDATLGTATLPILTDAAAEHASFRINEKGKEAFLSANYTPTASALVFSVDSVADLDVGDTVYLSNMLLGQTAGLMGVIEAVSASSVTIDSAYIASAAASFPIGSTAARVTNVTYDSPSDWSGITRDSELGAVTIYPGSNFSLSYLGSDGAVLALPLTADVIRNDLAAIQISVSVRGFRKMSDNSNYLAQAQQTVAIRNVNILR